MPCANMAELCETRLFSTGRCWSGPGSGGRGTCRGDFYQMMRGMVLLLMMIVNMVYDFDPSNGESWL